jgi:hypothetical protein
MGVARGFLMMKKERNKKDSIRAGMETAIIRGILIYPLAALAGL